MADDILIQGKIYPWLVDDQGRAHVIVKGEDTTETGVAKLVPRYDVVSATISYVGYAQPGTAGSVAAWQILRLTQNPEGDLTGHYADGNADFDNVWDNRASLSYS